MRATAIRQDRVKAYPQSYFDNANSNERTGIQQFTHKQYVPIENYKQSAIRPMSLPANKRIQSNYTTTIEDNSAGKKDRRYKIFDNNPALVNNYIYGSQIKKNNVPAFGNGRIQATNVLLQRNIISPLQPLSQPKVIPTMVQIPNRTNHINQFSITSPLQICTLSRQNEPQFNKIIINRHDEKQIEKPLSSNIVLQLNQKDQQIKYLKLQIQRYRRCQRLNKQNSALNKKIVEHLQDMTIIQSTNKNQSLLETSIQKRKSGNVKSFLRQEQQYPTPIQSLDDLRIINLPPPQKDEIHLKKEPSVSKLAEKADEPVLKNALQKQDQEESLIIAVNPQRIITFQSFNDNPVQPFQTMTFQDEQQQICQPHSPKANKNKEVSMYIQNYQQTYHQTNRMAKTFIENVPMNRRLSEMNRILQVNNYSFRNRTKTKQKHQNKHPFNERGKSSSHYNKWNKIYLQ